MTVTVIRGGSFDSRAYQPYLKSAIPAQSGLTGATISLNANYYIAAGANATWTATGLTALGLAINASTGLITGTLSGVTGSFTVTCTNAVAAYTSASTVWTVTSSLTWSTPLPNPLQVPQGSYFDLTPYITGTPSGITDSQTLPSGVTLSTSAPWRLNATVGATIGGSTLNNVFTLVAATADSDWATRAAASGVTFANNFSGYANRAALMAQMQTWYSSLYNNGLSPTGAKYSHTGNWAVDPYIDPVPVGEKARILLDTVNKLSGTQSVKFLTYNSQGPMNSEGPVFEVPLTANPAGVSQIYFQFAVRFDSGYLDQDAGGNGSKFMFCDQYTFGGGQFYLTRNGHHFRGQRDKAGVGASVANALSWPQGVIPPVSTTTSLQYYSFMNRGPQSSGALNDTNDINMWERRYGIHRNYDPFDLASDPDYATLPQFVSGQWYVFTVYIDRYFAGAIRPGLVKVWFSKYGEAPELLIGGMRDMGLYQTSIRSFRPVMRANEDTDVWQLVDGGCNWSEFIVSTNAINHPGGFALPYPGAAVPPNYPPFPTVTEY